MDRKVVNITYNVKCRQTSVLMLCCRASLMFGITQTLEIVQMRVIVEETSQAPFVGSRFACALSLLRFCAVNPLQPFLHHPSGRIPDSRRRPVAYVWAICWITPGIKSRLSTPKEKKCAGHIFACLARRFQGLQCLRQLIEPYPG